MRIPKIEELVKAKELAEKRNHFVRVRKISKMILTYQNETAMKEGSGAQGFR
jgi:hypothetical protein